MVAELFFWKLQKILYSHGIYYGNMATQMITVKLDDSFLKDVDQVVRTKGYQNRTEFIRNALRETVDKAKMEEAILELAHLKGTAKKRTSAKEYEIVRKRAFEELEKLNWFLLAYDDLRYLLVVWSLYLLW